MADHQAYSHLLNEVHALLPQTPEPEQRDCVRGNSPLVPSPPRLTQAKLKIKRRRNATDSSPSQPSLRFPLRQASRAYQLDHTPQPFNDFERYDHDDLESDAPLPSIEISSVHSVSPPFTVTPSLSECTVRAGVDHPPPRTPVHQLANDNDEKVQSSSDDWESSSDQPVTQPAKVVDSRPSTANSAFTRATFRSQVDDELSTGTAATSPSPDLDPTPVPPVKLTRLSSPFNFKLQDDVADKARRQTSTLTEEQERHLWCTYMRYLEDPTHTPFKMLPGSLPPTGVTERVVREARKTWKAIRSAKIARSQNSLTAPLPVSGAAQPRVLPAQWPSTDGGVRKRLHMLCRRKPMLAPHYARMIYRTPSPFTSSSTQNSAAPAAPVVPGRDSSVWDRRSDALPDEQGSADQLVHEKPSNLAFATRELDVSLATSTADSMQPDSFLAQLGRSSDSPLMVSTPGDNESPTKQSATSHGSGRLDSNKRPNPYLEEAFTFDITKLGIEPKKTSAPPHQRSRSLHHNFFGRSGLFDGTQLASPFAPFTRQTRAETVRESHASLPPLLSPFQMGQPMSRRLSKVSKLQRPQLPMGTFGPSHFRRQSHDAVQAAISQPPIVRNRGLTLSALQGSRGSHFATVGRLDLSDHPQEMDEMTSAEAHDGLAPPLSFLSDPPRLSSPFRPGISAKTFPRMHAAPAAPDAVMSDAPLVAPQPRRRLHGIVRPPPDNPTLATWRSLPRGTSPL